MTRNAWIIVVLAMLTTAAAVVVLVVVSNSPTYIPIDLDKLPPPKKPARTALTDERIEQLKRQLEDPDAQRRFDAVNVLIALAEKNPARLGPVLVIALDSKDPKVRDGALMGLGTIKYAPAAEQLTALLNDEHKDVRAQAGQALVAMGQIGLGAVMQGLAENRFEDPDDALVVVIRITGRSFSLGQKGRREALRFWAQQNKQP